MQVNLKQKPSLNPKIKEAQQRRKQMTQHRSAEGKRVITNSNQQQ
jgi:hypothetical protein